MSDVCRLVSRPSSGVSLSIGSSNLVVRSIHCRLPQALSIVWIGLPSDGATMQSIYRSIAFLPSRPFGHCLPPYLRGLQGYFRGKRRFCNAVCGGSSCCTLRSIQPHLASGGVFRIACWTSHTISAVHHLAWGLGCHLDWGHLLRPRGIV